MNLKAAIEASINTKKKILEDEKIIAQIKQVAALCIETYNEDGKVLFCGNGGSAADAQHLAAELSGRFYYDREPLYAEALSVNTSYITAVGNDYSYDMVFSRMVKAAGKKSDVLIAISTSGNSANVVKAVEQANKLDMKTIGFTGENGGELNKICDVCVKVPSTDTPRIQESHILIGHIVCEIVEETMFPK